jgi:large subunit ribosomal protein L23
LLRPYLSEKSTYLNSQSQYVFEINPKANKYQVTQAIKAIYGIKPLKVRIVKIKSKQIRYGRTIGETKERKKAIVKLPSDKKIDIYK